jgi:hypothetical protein
MGASQENTRCEKTSSVIEREKTTRRRRETRMRWTGGRARKARRRVVAYASPVASPVARKDDVGEVKVEEVDGWRRWREVNVVEEEARARAATGRDRREGGGSGDGEERDDDDADADADADIVVLCCVVLCYRSVGR